MTRRNPPRILLGTVEIAGFYGALRDGLRELGVAAALYTVEPHPFGYGEDRETERFALVRWTRATRRRANAAALRHPYSRLPWRALELALQPFLLAWAAFRFDAFIFGYGTSITAFPAVELRLLKLLGRRIVCVFHGSDTRPPYMDGSVPAADGAEGRACVALSVRARARARLADRFADCVVENPSSAHFHARACAHVLLLGIPVRRPPRPCEGSRAQGPIRILHSPSNPVVKGTGLVVAAVDRLRARGHDVELVLVTGKPHAEVLNELARCDFVVDQLYSDTPMAGFAAEAASFGKPSVVGGYAEEVFARWIPPAGRPPTLYVRPEEVEEAIERLVVDVDLRLELGRRARAYVEEHCTPRRVAERYLRLIRGAVPPEWLFDPREIGYVHGCGLPEDRARERVAAVLAEAGPAGLCVSDKPGLERRLVAFAHGAVADAPAPVAAPG